MVPSGAAPPKLDNGFNPSDFAEWAVMAPVANSWLPLSQNSLAPGVFASRQVPNDPNGDPAKVGQGSVESQPQSTGLANFLKCGIAEVKSSVTRLKRRCASCHDVNDVNDVKQMFWDGF